jgi:(p)ppGpp synthase/HD superfamily hydrolase
MQSQENNLSQKSISQYTLENNSNKMITSILIGSSLIVLAEQIAREAHSGQYRRDGITPYIVHPEAVASRVNTPEEKATAWLHDVLEDTNMTQQDLLNKGIPENVVTAVVTMTKTQGVSYMDYLVNVKNNPIARVVKIADMNSNLADTPTPKQIAKYAEGLKFLEA